MRATVLEISLFTVATDPRDNLAVGTWSTRIWKANVSRDPPAGGEEEEGRCGWRGPSGRMAKPDGKRATESGSPPFRMPLIAATSIGA